MERNLVLAALFAALIAALGFLPQMTLGSGVPISAQSLGVMLAGALLGARRGALALVIFFVLVAIGLPVLAGGRGGLGVFVSPTAGFLLGFLPAAFVTGLIVERWRSANPKIVAGTAALIGGVGVLYVCGIVGMALVLKKTLQEATLLATPFLPGDVIKAAVTAWLAPVIWRARPGSRPRG